jgi:hypothetical protein
MCNDLFVPFRFLFFLYYLSYDQFCFALVLSPLSLPLCLSFSLFSYLPCEIYPYDVRCGDESKGSGLA